MFKKRNKLKNEESNIQPNEMLEIDNLADYQNVFTQKKGAGYRGLLAAYEAKADVVLVTNKDNGETEEVNGTISHYDENYSQLVVVAGNTLKRLTFDQIIEVTFPNGENFDEESID